MKVFKIINAYHLVNVLKSDEIIELTD